jgi:hypothetical protein
MPSRKRSKPLRTQQRRQEIAKHQQNNHDSQNDHGCTLYTRSHPLMKANISPSVASPRKNIAEIPISKDIVVAPKKAFANPLRATQMKCRVS